MHFSFGVPLVFQCLPSHSILFFQVNRLLSSDTFKWICFVDFTQILAFFYVKHFDFSNVQKFIVV